MILRNITKKIAHSGLCSRRDAKTLVTSGKVQINGKIVRTPTAKVEDRDEILVNNKKLKREDELKIWVFHKPVGYITSNKDPQGRPTIFDILPKDLPRLVSVGRLDMKSEGLLLLTNNGELARYFELPENKLKRLYHVRVYGSVSERKLKNLEKGSVIGGIKYGKIFAKIIKQENANSWLEFILTEGKNREIRKIVADMGLSISRLKRVEYAGYKLGSIKKGEIMQSKIREETYEDYLRKAEGS